MSSRETERAAPLDGLMLALGHEFSDRKLLEVAMTHASFRNEEKNIEYDNERQEFLGDSVLGAVISHLLFTAYPDMAEGLLTRYKAVLVSEQGLVDVAKSMELGRYIKLGRGEVNSGGREKNSVLANTMEAVVASVYLDAGFGVAFDVVSKLFKDRLESVHGREMTVDFKTKLQELVQLHFHTLPSYEIINVDGPDHDRTYQAIVRIEEQIRGEGGGRSKKEAEQAAAKSAFSVIVLSVADSQDAEPVKSES